MAGHIAIVQDVSWILKAFSDNGSALGCVVVTDHSSGFEPDVRQYVAKELANCTQLMPFQAASLRQLEVLSGR